MDQLEQLIANIGQLSDGMESFQRRVETKLDTEIQHRENLERRVNLGKLVATGPGGTSASTGEYWLDTKSQRPIRVYSHHEPIREAKDSAYPSFGRFLRGICLGQMQDDAHRLELERKDLAIVPDASGGYAVPGPLGAEFIDLLRAQLVLSQAGCRTIPMDSKTLTLARQTADPTCTWHGEGKKLEMSDPAFGAWELNAKTLTCLVPLSLELSQDAPNIEQVVVHSTTEKCARTIEAAAFRPPTVDAGAAPQTSLTTLTGRNVVGSIGAPANWDHTLDGIAKLLGANVPMGEIGALIGHPDYWHTMSILKTGLSGDQTTLLAPPDMRNRPFLTSTSAPLVGSTATAFIARWADLVLGVRKDITIRVLTESLLGSTLQIALLVYARVDWNVTRPTSICSLEGIVTS